VLELRATKRRKDADAVKARLDQVTLQIERQVGEGDKLFGSVTSRDLEEALAAQGVAVDRKKIHLPEPIKGLGQYTVDIKLSPEVTAQVKVWVVAKS
jgi:large subunit ribosomal protein L9